MNALTAAAAALSLTAAILALPGCFSAPSDSLPATDHSIASQWVRVTDSAWERQIVPELRAPSVAATTLTTPVSAAQHKAAPRAPASQPAVIRQHTASLSLAPARGRVSKHRGTDYRAPALLDAGKQRKQVLVQRYAEGDDAAAVELARMCYAQGETATADKVLDFAVRKGNRTAIALKAERQKAGGGG